MGDITKFTEEPGYDPLAPIPDQHYSVDGQERLYDFIVDWCYNWMPDPVFELSSGEYSRYYYDLDDLLHDRRTLIPVTKEMLRLLTNTGTQIVGGPAMGGALLAHSMAAVSNMKSSYHPLSSFYTKVDKCGYERNLSDGYPGQFPTKRAVTVVDDVLTTGMSVRDTIEFAERTLQCEVVRVAAIVDRHHSMSDELRSKYDVVSLFSATGDDGALEINRFVASEPDFKPMQVRKE